MHSHKPSKPRSSLAQRVLTATILVASLILIIWHGGWLLAVLVCVALGRAVYEELSVFQKAGHRPIWWASFVIPVIALPVFFLEAERVLMLLLPLLLMGIMISVMIREKPCLEDIAVSALPVASIILPGVCLFEILTIAPRSLQNYYLALLFIIPVMTDTFAYFTGKHFGGKKLCPQISPNKTVSGAIGGLVGGMLCAVITAWIFALVTPQTAYPALWSVVIVGIVGSVVSQMGDLFASLVKRHCKVKDFGTLFPGHGGMMDRIDSILFAGVVVYLFYHLQLLIV